MCFSSTASFSSGALLAVAGAASMVRAQGPAQKLLAGIPLVFCAQQLTEGVLWLSLMHPAWHQWQAAATCLFLIFAQAVWPVYIPLAALCFEAGPRRRVMSLLLLCGIALSAYIVYALFRYPVYASVASHHIQYTQGFPLARRWYYGVLYFLPTIVAPAISSKKDLRWLGYLFFISYAGTRLLFHFYEISVWCFFGALISTTVFFMVGRPRQAKWYLL